MINKFNYEVYALDYLEGTLSPEMVIEMERFLKANPMIESELSEMMELIILEPDEKIVYEYKEKLYKREESIIVPFNWRRSLAIAASIALLLFTYFLGYQSGQKEEIQIAKTEQIDFKQLEKIAESNSEKSETIKPEKNIEPIKKITQNPKNSIVKSTKKKTIIPTVNKSSAPSILLAKEPVVITNTVKNHPTDIIIEQQELTPIVDKKLIEKQVEVAEKVAILTNPLPTLSDDLERVESTNDTLNDLSKALQASLVIDQEKLVANTKKKRTLKDFLGKFPVNNLKEAIIPTFYRDEPAGQ